MRWQQSVQQVEQGAMRKQQKMSAQPRLRRSFIFIQLVVYTGVKSTILLYLVQLDQTQYFQINIIYYKIVCAQSLRAVSSMPLNNVLSIILSSANNNKKNQERSAASTANVGCAHGRQNEKESEAYFWIM